MDGSGPQDLYNVYLPGYAQTFQDHAESTSCNLNSGGDGRRDTRTDLKHVEDRQVRARVTPGGGGQTDHTRSGDTTGGGETTLVRVNEGKRRPRRAHILNCVDSSSFSEKVITLT